MRLEQRLRELAGRYGTPLYVFDSEAFRERAELVREAFGDTVGLCYSIKANPFLLAALPDVFSAIEVCSPGELTICERAGTAMESVILSGVNKTGDYIERALTDGVKVLTAESPLHMEMIERAAARLGKKADVLLRLSSGSQFGMDEEDLSRIVSEREAYPHTVIRGLHFFTGTQKKKAAVIRGELAELTAFADGLKSRLGFTVERLEYGTGLYADYFGARPEESERALLGEIAPAVREAGKRYALTIEMGRFFAAPCGSYITRVMDVKMNRGYRYAIVDGGMHQLRYDGQMKGMQTPPVLPLTTRTGENRYTLCGSLCTTADVLATVGFETLAVGDLLAFLRTGAYSVTEGSAAFLSRELPAVVLTGDGRERLLRAITPTDPFNTPGR